ncbi:Beta-1,4-N-acetylgalactosaminyltransferase bre-4 [Schistosoma japonicum]|uniref:Beta-1,4-galactosyltransferase n=1 Tax=Schistosoma japonicum TaxID=6182 RepID=C1LF65_SCHJA|nr:Beta-1,4-N-acetylgalactosaminyltransferase bre-4 [Schistosoma japonicum]KAH8864720.1 Beta-1,4-N-acetylgalactosaminyltransferase bre-4 [Schistosoma japonicum]TNN19038.1 Beta-1,4-N-acetylgalactosaminyltransferase bre-4 [Schistosoma japonicum]CAX73343.1 Beta-1,4-galactosyltransferase 2 [Schistosoma japonicum]
MLLTFTSQRICIGCSISLFLLGSMLLYVHIYRSQNVPIFSRKLTYNVTGADTYIVSPRQECPKGNPHPIGLLKIASDVLSWSSLVEKYASSSLQPKVLLSKGSNYSVNLTLVVRNDSLIPHNLTDSLINYVGLWRPVVCDPTEKLAIIIPYRNRDVHLRMFVDHMHTFLRNQLLMYTIFVVNQAGTTYFNRALLLNVGFIESKRVANFDCFIFHDVDLLPEDDRNLYHCTNQPRHLSVAVDKFNYRLPYLAIFGGAVAFTEEQFVKVGGFSNKYFGWGGEDDDLYARVVYHNYSVIRYPEEIARYKMISHKKDPNNPDNPERHLWTNHLSE